MTVIIKNRWNGDTIKTMEAENLRCADLSGADLSGAKITNALTLVGKRPLLMLGPIGSRSDMLMCFVTSGGLRIRAGCFLGTDKEFAAKVKETHGDNEHSQEYEAALAMARKHFKLWGVDALIAELNK